MRPTTLVLAVCAAASLAFAQFETSEVLGTVRDPSRSVVAKAAVTLTNQETGIVAKTESDDNGNYDFLNVRVGRYAVTVEHAGFSRFTTEVAVDVQTRQRVDAAMQVGAVTESVTVNDAAAALQTDSSEHGQVVNTTAVAELPLNGRNYADLALLSTNTVKSPISATFSATG
ncbi:MAG: carboxypeptidase-like regulatory domain-containing protein, partial [Bryobacteraceae bacterium]